MLSMTSRLRDLSLTLAAGLAFGPGAVLADQVIATDLIVQGSACVGLDCVNNENFGFDTLRLKENNLRLHFDDTSASASFPRNDWRIVANDSGNGGASYLGIEDATAGRIPFRVEAGARANALYVEGDGHIGIGTANPVVNLHAVDGNTPTLRLEQDGSSGFTPQTWDLAGNEANFFIRDVTGGSLLPFRIRRGAPTSAIDIAADGDVGIGTSSPDADLEIAGSGVKFAMITSTDNNAVQFRLKSNSNNNRRILAVDENDAVEAQISLNEDSIYLAGPTVSGANLWAVIDATGITTQGPDCGTPCDGVFDPAIYEVESIEEHAAFMWENKYLWGVGPTGPDTPYNVTRKTAGILHELEKAHIYIAELNERIKSRDAEIETLSAELVDRIGKLENTLR